jgi:D-sedoheptulose 7-phosphate isomerase
MIINQIKENFRQAQEVLDNFISGPQIWEKLEKAGEFMVQALKSGNKIISCGNGGSLCDAMHFAEELTGRFQQDRIPLPAIAISDPSHITCVANDFGFDQIFSRTVEALGRPGDLLLCISTSGNSQNVINAIHSAQHIGMKVVGLTGKTGGQIAKLCDVEIYVPYNGYSDRIQEIHIKVIHSLVNYIELAMEEQLKRDKTERIDN